MRVVFMGTPAFGVEALRTLAVERDVVGVYTRPDTPSKRGNKLHPPAIKEAALELGLSVYQPTTLRDPEEVERLRDLTPDVIVVIAYGAILPPEVLAIPLLGCINVHASLLPRWRGAAPIQRAILAGDERTGVTIMRMEEGLDTGPVADMVSIPIEQTDDIATLSAKLSKLGSAALSTALTHLEMGEITWTPQEEAGVTYAEKITKDEVLLSPTLSVEENLKRVRTSSDQAPARCAIETTEVRILRAHAAASLEVGEQLVGEAGVRVTKNTVLFGCADGQMIVDTIKPQGKGVMEAAAWARGLQTAPTSWTEVSA